MEKAPPNKRKEERTVPFPYHSVFSLSEIREGKRSKQSYEEGKRVHSHPSERDLSILSKSTEKEKLENPMVFVEMTR